MVMQELGWGRNKVTPLMAKGNMDFMMNANMFTHASITSWLACVPNWAEMVYNITWTKMEYMYGRIFRLAWAFPNV